MWLSCLKCLMPVLCFCLLVSWLLLTRNHLLKADPRCGKLKRGKKRNQYFQNKKIETSCPTFCVHGSLAHIGHTSVYELRQDFLNIYKLCQLLWIFGRSYETRDGLCPAHVLHPKEQSGIFFVEKHLYLT